MKAFKKLYGKKYTFKNLLKHYIKTKEIDTFDKYINTLEYLGKNFQIDDSKIYTLHLFNKILKAKINKSIPNLNQKFN